MHNLRLPASLEEVLCLYPGAEIVSHSRYEHTVLLPAHGQTFAGVGITALDASHDAMGKHGKWIRERAAKNS